MKKTNLFVAVLVAGSFAMLLGSCKKNETESDIIISLPQYQEEMNGRAYIDINDNNSFKWNANDEVMIYNLDEGDDLTGVRAIYQTTAEAEGMASARFRLAAGETALGAKKDAGYFVFYPVDKVADNASFDGLYQTFTVEDTQDYTTVGEDVPTIDPEGMGMACPLTKLGGSFELKHIFGGLKLNVQGDATVTSIEVEDNQFNLAGKVAMKVNAVDMNTFSGLEQQFIAQENPYENTTWMQAWSDYKDELGYQILEEGGKVMTLDCGAGVQVTNEGKYFLIGLRPGALKYGFTIRVTTADGTVHEFVSGDSWHYGIKAGILKNVSLNLTNGSMD